MSSSSTPSCQAFLAVTTCLYFCCRFPVIGSRAGRPVPSRLIEQCLLGRYLHQTNFLGRRKTSRCRPASDVTPATSMTW